MLSGDDARLLVRRLSDYVTGRKVAGGSVVLTVNPKAQRAACEGLAGQDRRCRRPRPPDRGRARDGQPSVVRPDCPVDPRLPAKIRAAYKTLLDDDRDPLVNRAVERTYPPGSTFKLVTAAAALSHGYTPQKRIPSPTVLDLPGTIGRPRQLRWRALR